MSKADKMIEALGYRKVKYPTDSDMLLYVGESFEDSIGFLLKIQEYSVPDGVANVAMHKAIHEKLKELGWIE